MELEIHTVLPKGRSELAQKISTEIELIRDSKELVSYLESQPIDVQKLLDLYHWKDVLILTHGMLRNYSIKLYTFKNLHDAKASSHSMDIDVVKSLLKFQIRLVKAAKDKRHYLTFEVIETLLKCPELEIIELCLELLFHICVPASAISANVTDDWVDSMEIPSTTATVVNSIFQQLSLKCSNFGIVEYLKGIRSMSDKDLIFPHPDSTKNPISITPFQNFGVDSLSQMCNSYHLNMEQVWDFIIAERVMAGFDNELEYRERIVSMRLFSFFILIHSRISPSLLLEHVKAGSQFLNDMLTLADISSETLISLDLKNPLRISYLCLENILVLLESQLKRRSPTVLQSNIMELLNLTNGESSNNSVHNEDLWISIVTSATAFSSLLFPTESVEDNGELFPLHFEGGLEKHFVDIGRFVRLGMELYALALTTRGGQHHVLVDIRVLSVIITLLKNLIDKLPVILENFLRSTVILGKSNNHLQILYVIAKGLYCLELTADRSGYLNAFRECEALQIVGKIIDIFGTFADRLEELLDKYPAAGNILESSLSVLHISIQKHRHSFSHGGITNIAESGHRLAYNPSFLMLGKYLFHSITPRTDILWVEYINVLKEAVDIEPTFLGVFLNSEVAQSIKNAFVQHLPFTADSRSDKLEVDRLYVPLVRFLVAICITSESKAYIVNSGIISFLIEGVQHDNSILPNSNGLSIEKIARVGKSLGQLVVDQESIKNTITSCLKSKLVELSVNASNCSSSDGVELSSPRMNVLMKLNNICVLIESMVAEGRRQMTEVVKELFSSCITQLLRVYPKTLPAPSQLLAQMSLRTNLNSPQYGFAACSKSVGSVLKIAMTAHPQSVVPAILTEIDNCLNSLGAAQQGLKCMSSRTVDFSLEEEEGTSQELVFSHKRRSRSRGNSIGGNSSANIHVLGILDSVPSCTIISDEQFTTDEKELQRRKNFCILTVAYLNLEWLSSLLVHALKMIQRSSSTSLITITAGKDVLRRLLGLFRSSVMEMSRYGSSKTVDKDLNQSRSSKGLLESFGCLELPTNFENRIPTQYLLRVIGQGGALIREGIEIDSSRIVFVAEAGSVLTATERRTTPSGLVRYLTTHGWISEYRRDSHKSPLVELLDIKGRRMVDPSEKIDDISLLLSQVEVMCSNMSRLHSTLRQVAMGLGKLTSYNSSETSIISSAPVNSSQMNTVVSNFVKGFYESLFESGNSVTAKIIEKVIHSPTPMTSRSDEDHPAPEPNSLNAPALCLLYGACVKNIILPTLEDKNGNFNIPLLRAFANHGVIRSFFESVLLVSRYLASEFSSLMRRQSKQLRPLGSNAVNALPGMLMLMKRLVDRELLIKSIPTNVSLRDEVGHYQVHDLLFQIVSAASETMIHILEEGLYDCFPSDIASDFLQIFLTLSKTLNSPLPSPKDVNSDNRPNRDRIGRAMGRSFGQENPSTMQALLGMGFDGHSISNAMEGTNSSDISFLMDALMSMQSHSNNPFPQTTRGGNNNPSVLHVEPNLSLPNLVSELSAWDNGTSNPLPLPAPSSSAASDFGTPPTTSSSSSTIPRPGSRSSGRGSGRHDIASTKKTEELDKPNLDVQGQKFRSYLERVLSFAPHVSFKIARNGVNVGKWDAKFSFAIFHSIKEFCLSCKKEFKTACGMEELWRDLHFSVMHFTNEPTENDMIHGPLCLLTLLLKEKDLCNEITDCLGPENLQHLASGLIRAIGNVAHVSKASELPNWFNSAILYICEVIEKVNQAEITALKDEQQIQEFVRKGVLRGSEEKEESTSLCEAKSVEIINSKIMKDNFFEILLMILSMNNQLKFSQECAYSIAFGLSLLLDSQELCGKFIAQKGLECLLSMGIPSTEDELTIGESLRINLALIVKKCLTTPAEIRDLIWDSILTLFKILPTNEKSLPVNQFLKGLSKLLISHPEEFFLVCKEKMRFFRTQQHLEGISLDGNQAKKGGEFHVVVRAPMKTDNGYSIYEPFGCAGDSLASKALSVLFESFEKSMNAMDEKKLFKPSDLLSACVESALALRRVIPIISLLLQEKTQLLDLMIQKCILSDDKVPRLPSSLKYIFPDASASATNHFMTAWSCTRWFLVLASYKGPSRNLMMDTIVAHLKSQCSPPLGVNPRVAKLCQLVILIVQSNRGSGHSTQGHKKEQGISLPAVEYLLKTLNIMPILVEAVLHVSLDEEFGSVTLVSILELIELVCRPKLIEHLDKRMVEPTTENDDCQQISLPSERLISSTPTQDSENFDPDHINEVESVNHSIEDVDTREERAEYQSGGEEEGEEENEHEDEEDDEADHEDYNQENDDYQDEEEEEQDDEDDGIVYGSQNDDYVNVESVGIPPGEDRFAEFPHRPRLNNIRAEFELPPPISESSNPHDGDAHPLLRGFHGLQGIDPQSHPELLSAILHTLREELDANQLPIRLPRVDSAQDLRRSAAVDLREALQATPLQSRHPLFEETSHIVGTAPSNGVVSSSNRHGIHPFRLPMLPHTMSFSAEHDDILSMPAVWPSGRRQNAHNRVSSSSSASANNDSQAAALPINGAVSAFESLFEQVLLEETNSHEDLNEDGSHSTITTFASRCLAQSIPSTQALQDPNPRQSGEDDSVRGGSIPPLIEINREDDNEGNEDMSVLTGPHDDIIGQVPVADEGSGISAAEEDLFVVEEGEEFGCEGADSHNASQSAITFLSNDAAPIASNPVIPPIIEIDQNEFGEGESNEDVSVLTVPQEEHPSFLQHVDSTYLSSTVGFHALDDDVHQIATDATQLLQPESTQPPRVTEELSVGPNLACPPGYDVDVFNSLPPDMQLEVIEQHSETTDNMRELIAASGFDYETIMSLPDDIRQEVLDQARRQIGATSAASGGSSAAGNSSASGSAAAVPQEIDNATFLATLPLELRAEVLLTADPEFLASLPADVVAEAQALRERAASNWQRQEILQSGMGHPIMPGRMLSRAAALPLAHNEPEEEEPFDSDENSDDGDFLHFRPPTHRFNPAVNQPRPRPSGPPRMSNGMMSVPLPNQTKVIIPSILVAAISKLIASKHKHTRQFTDIIMKIVFNITAFDKFRDAFIKLMVGLMIEDKHLTDSCLQQLVPVNNRPSGYSIGDFETLGRVELIRCFYVLTQLSCNNNAFVYAMLQERSSNYEVVDPTAPPRGESSKSLLESLFSLINQFVTQSKGTEIEQLVNLIEQLTKPLAFINDGATDPDDQPSDKFARVKIPLVRLSRESLFSFCDLLLNDISNERVFNCITASVGRLAKIKTNAFILQDIMRAIMMDLSQIVAEKLSSFAEYLKSVVGNRVSVVAMEALSLEDHKGVSSSPAKNSVMMLPTMIPWGEFSSRYYGKLYRVIQSLRNIEGGNMRHHGMQDFSVSDDLNQVWGAFDEVFSALKCFYSDEDEKANSGSSGSSSSSQQTTLLSILRRLLPMLECFMNLHTSDILKVSSEHQVSASGKDDRVAATTTTTMSQQAPGHRYRTSQEYLRANISLALSDNSNSYGEGSSPIGSGSTFAMPSGASGLRRQISFGGAASMTRVCSVLTNKSQRLLAFVQCHRGLINLLIKSKPNLLLDENFSSLVKVVQLRHYLTFENKRKYFYTKLKKFQQSQPHRRSITLQIRRNQVFEDSFHQLRSKRAEDLRGRLQIGFYGEEGIDAGGLTREWYMILAREIFNPNYALFMAAADGATFQPNPLSIINTNHLDYFKFVGRIIGKAVCDGHLMDAHFTRSFYKHVLGMPIDFIDLEATEPDYYKSLKMMLDNPLDLLGFSGMTFTAEIQKFGRTEDIDLIPNGSQIVVTDENKHEYVRLIAHHRMTTAINSQIDSFLSGFYDLVPPELICIFSPAELELLICGLPDVNVDELQLHTEYNQYRATDDSIVWFWQALRGFNREERAAFLQFVTGTSKVPLGGFVNLQGMRGNQKFSIHKTFGGETGKLPSAHTCYNQLDLPVYSSAEELREKLLMAIKEGSEGFGFA